MVKFILASGSPRRRELLQMLDLDFTVDTSRSVDETVPPGMKTEDIPLYLSQLKAAPYVAELKPGQALITADTVVILDGKVIGKPKDKADAARILGELQGKTHTVVTGVTVVAYGQEPVSFSETTEVEFSTLSDREIAYYVERYSPLDKAGAYGIQEWIGAAAVSRIKGSFYNVMGLPVNHLYRLLKKMGLVAG